MGGALSYEPGTPVHVDRLDVALQDLLYYQDLLYLAGPSVLSTVGKVQ